MDTHNTQDNNYSIKIRAWPITHEYANNKSVTCPTRNPNMLFIEPKIKLKLYCLPHENKVSPIVYKFKPWHYPEMYCISRDSLKADNIMDPTSQAWNFVSNMVSDICVSIPLQLNKVNSQNGIRDITNQLVAKILKEACVVAKTDGITAVLISIKKEAFVGHDGFLNCVFGIDRWMRTQKVLERCVSKVRTSVDLETVKSEIIEGFTDCGLLNCVTDQDLDLIATRVLERVCVTA